jgi:hypothetical protein
MEMISGWDTGIDHLNQNGDTGMYQFDFISVAFGYILGIILYASMSNIMYMEENDENQ